MTMRRLYARLLRLYPAAHYARFGDEMLVVFEQADAACRQRGQSALRFGMREFGGLLLGIVRERWQTAQADSRPWILRPRLMVGLLLMVSVVLACAFSLSYWEYIVRPASLFGQIDQIDRVSLVRFDADAQPTTIPLDVMTQVDTQMLPPTLFPFQLEPDDIAVATSSALDPALAGQITDALTAQRVDFGAAPMTLPRPMTRRPNVCETCYYEGIALQDDGSLQTTHLDINLQGTVTGNVQTFTIYPHQWDYYIRLAPVAYLVEGRTNDGTPLLFVSLLSNSIGGDRYRYYEFVFDTTGGVLTLRDAMQYRFDISGLEGLTAPVITVALFVPLVLLWLLAVGLLLSARFMRRQTRRWATPGCAGS